VLRSGKGQFRGGGLTLSCGATSWSCPSIGEDLPRDGGIIHGNGGSEGGVKNIIIR